MVEAEKRVSSDGKRVVQILTSTVVKPDKETPKLNVWLSNIDLVSAFMSFTPILYVYRNRTGVSGDGSSSSFFPLEEVKASMAKALTVFHLYAGRFGEDETGRPEIKCTGDGVPFFEAVCDCSLEEFGELIPSEELQDLLVPHRPSKPYPVISYQLTRFKCGSVTIGILTHHTTGDGMNSVRFFNSWADITRGVLDPETIIPPVLDRTPLRARNPPLVEYDHDEYIMPIANGNSKPPVPAVSKTLRLSKEQVAMLKLRASGKDLVATTFTAIVAHSWRCVTKARGLGPEQTTRLLIGCDSKAILNPPLSPFLNANAIVHLSATVPVDELLSGGKETYHVSKKIEEAKSMACDKYVRSVVDFLEIKDGSRGVPPVGPTELLAISWMRLPMYEADFGWGKPEFMGRAEVPYPGRLYLGKIPGDDGVWVTTTLDEDYMPEFTKFFYGDISDEEKE